MTLIFQKKSSPINGRNSLGDGWLNEPSPGSIIPDASVKIMKSPSHPLRPWSKFPIYIPCSNAFEYSFLNNVMEQIQNTEVRRKVLQLKELSEKILNEVKERPEKTSQISTFVDYYVPTTINILNAYRRAEATGIEGENISKTKKQIESMVDSSILIVFHKQLDSLFGTDALDISLELSVLNEMMIREGISGEKLEAQTAKNADGSDIRLTL